MLRAYKITTKIDGDSLYFYNYGYEGEKIYENNKNSLEKVIKNSKLKNGNIDAEILRQLMFPEIEADVFISHSHNDFSEACKLAGYLNKKLNKRVFIDSVFWNNIYDLGYELNSKYSKMSDGYFSYEKHEYMTSRLYILLITALSNMINKSDTFIFLNTQNSLLEDETTHSPWIYYELFEASKLQKTILTESKHFATDSMPVFVYDVKDYVNKLQSITIYDIKYGNIKI